MIRHASRNRSRFAYRLLSAFIAFTFSLTSILPPGYAQVLPASPAGGPQTLLNLPVPGTLVPPSPAFVPVLLKGITIHPENPLQFDFIVDSGNTDFKEDRIKSESERLVKYFLASMTIPKDDLWVNLSPYESDKIIPDELGRTELGRDMLAQDYILKQLTASLMYPEKELGKEFWARVYKLAEEKYGTTEIPVNTFNKVWILPETATVYEHGQTVYIVEARLKVMLDSDYVAMQHETKDQRLKTKDFQFNAQESSVISLQSSVSSEIIKEIILPAIEKEVNEGQNFAPLRQIYHSLILAKWYKETIKNSLLSKIYIDQKKIAGVNVDDETLKDQIYAQYMEAYKKGVFNYIKEDYDQLSSQPIPRKYFSGGEFLRDVEIARTGSQGGIERSVVGKNYQLALAVVPQKKGATSSPIDANEGDEETELIRKAVNLLEQEIRQLHGKKKTDDKYIQDLLPGALELLREGYEIGIRFKKEETNASGIRKRVIRIEEGSGRIGPMRRYEAFFKVYITDEMHLVSDRMRVGQAYVIPNNVEIWGPTPAKPGMFESEIRERGLLKADEYDTKTNEIIVNKNSPEVMEIEIRPKLPITEEMARILIQKKFLTKKILFIPPNIDSLITDVDEEKVIQLGGLFDLIYYRSRNGPEYRTGDASGLESWDRELIAKAYIEIVPQSSSALVIDEAFQREFLAGVEGDTRTFVMIKPDALERGQKEAVVREIERQGFAVEVGPEIRLTRAQASEFYQVHQDRPFFKDLITLITSGPVIPLFLKANGAVEKFNAVKDEVRKTLGAVDTKATSNRIHAADSVEHAVEEAKVVFQVVAAQAGAEGTPSSPLEMDAKVRQSERLLLKAGEAGEAELDVTRQGSETMRKQVDAAMAMTLGLVVELPEGLGEVDMAEELNRVNIVWVKTQPRSPPVEGHSGARRNALYLIAENQEFLQETPAHLIASVLAEEVIKLRAKQRTLQNNLSWTDELAERAEEFAKIKTLPLRMNILGLMAKEIPNPEKVKADTFNGKRAEEALARLKPGAFKWFEEAVKDLDGAKEVKGALEEGKLAVMLFAAGEASRLRASLLNARIIDNQTPLKDYRLWNVDLKNTAQKVIENLELLRKLKVDGEGQLNLLEGKDIDFASVINRLKEIYVTGDIYKEINKTNPDPDRTTVKKLLKSDIQDLSAVIEHFSQVDVQRQVAGAKNLKLGRRHLEALRDGIRLDGSSYGFNADKVIENMPVIITVNLQVMKDVQEDLITNNFYGFTSENVYLVVNDLYPGMVYENGKWMFDRASRVENLTNYNHGFNIINATQKGVGYRYDRTKGRFVLEGTRSVFDMVKTTAETVVVHRINDMMLLDPQLAMDTGMYAVYQHRRAHEGTNVMVDVLNNLSGQKGGLWMTTDDHEEGTGFLLEGLAAKTAKIEGALAILRQWVREKFELQDIPYNRLYTYFDIEAVEEGLRENGGIIPLSVKDDKPRKGVWSPEIPSGDITIVPGLKVGAVIRGNDTLVDGGILEKPAKYEKDKQKGAIIHDFKQLGNLPETMKIVLHQDRPRSSSPLTGSEKDDKRGGIDMNAIDLERRGAGVDIQFDPVEFQQIIDAGIDGFAPVIINITPLPSILPLLGMDPANKEEEQGELVNAG